MSSDEQLRGNVPGGIEGLTVAIIAHDGEYYDITTSVNELSLYESIYYPYIHGDLQIVDNSMMLSDFPFIGQERAILTWKRDDVPVSRVYYVSKVSNATKRVDGFGVYELTINSVTQQRNAVALFSQSYKGRSDEIIADVFDEHLGIPVTRMDGLKGKTSHNVVFPYMKPLQAVDMVRKNVLADDNTPMFLYDTFYPRETRLDSYARMYAREPIMTIESKKPTNTSSEGQSYRQLTEDRGMVYDTVISRGHNMYESLNKGVFGSTATITDPSNSEYQMIDFDYEVHAPPIAKNWVSPEYIVYGGKPNEQLATRNLHLNRNSRAFNDDFPSLNTIDDYDLSVLNSYVRRHSMTVVRVYMDSVAVTPETGVPFTVGQTVTYNLIRFKPRLKEGEEHFDKINSGKYIISSIRHFIKTDEYRMSVELIRDGIGEDGEL